MGEYLDPRSDIVFKRIFMDHPEILKSFLNAVLPFEVESQCIVDLAVLPAEQTPESQILKDSYVDVKCVDGTGRHFVVEMQMNWTNAFIYRVLFNASKAYARQLEKGGAYSDLKPVYGLSILDDRFPRETDLPGGRRETRRNAGGDEEGKYYHHYRLTHVDDPNRVIDQLQLIFVELPEFRKAKPKEARRLHWAWLRFLSEAGDVGEEKGLSVEAFKKEVLVSPELEAAAEISKVTGYTAAQLDGYDRFWDHVRRERTLIEGSRAEGRTEMQEIVDEERRQKEEERRQKEEERGLKEEALRREALLAEEIERLRRQLESKGESDPR
jgi:predicted transposase/invertase (TIGR01784 family)